MERATNNEEEPACLLLGDQILSDLQSFSNPIPNGNLPFYLLPLSMKEMRKPITKDHVHQGYFRFRIFEGHNLPELSNVNARVVKFCLNSLSVGSESFRMLYASDLFSITNKHYWRHGSTIGTSWAVLQVAQVSLKGTNWIDRTIRGTFYLRLRLVN